MRLLREPLLHFLLIGAVVFGAFTYLADPEPPREEAAITVTLDQTQRLAEAFEATWRRAPTGDEIEGLIEGYLREEVLVREALALSLDQNDAVIRQRLAQKMAFLIESAVQSVEPGQGELATFFQENADAYQVEHRLAFEQIFLGPEASEDLVLSIRDALADGGEPQEIGAQTLLPFAQPLSGATRIDGAFGPGFFAQLTSLPGGNWTGPVASAYGDHLVRVTENTPGFLPPLEAIQDIVLRDWRNTKASEIFDARIGELLAGYTVERPDLSEITEALQ